MRGRWLTEDAPGAPQFNMDADLALFEALREGRDTLPSVRVYFWDRPCVTFGRLQDKDAVRAAFPDLTLVRRPTGGLAVLHGDDLTVSIITRADWLPRPARPGVLSSYRVLVAGLVEAFAAVGVPARLGEETRIRVRSDAVRCFARLAACDVADAQTGAKIAGCAQRRDAGTILQQMSVPRAAVSNQAAFARTLREALAAALQIEAWLDVDTRKAL